MTAPEYAASQAPALHVCPQIGHNRTPGQQAGYWRERECPECRKPFKPNRANQLFCAPEHKAEWSNRQTVRGRVAVPFAYAARVTRDGSRGTADHRATGKVAARIHRRLVQKWRDEDRAAGRMDIVEYMARRLKLIGEPE